jgi:hypothetical protein
MLPSGEDAQIFLPLLGLEGKFHAYSGKAKASIFSAPLFRTLLHRFSAPFLSTLFQHPLNVGL